ncbi:aldehyde dehydrogenase family protein [Streptomyces sp. WMMC500]|uniref:aldehyde dehydrogenase family protein n=1 Tax=Streptomyces sp. WMMC500 TaxID=3015154 RepID=UPI00248B3E6A|nr:aldehyde dehydrogenase family protein [Streptomyces sp. WMMC500]WBB60229.1 aldehyde dehydrogenase family protein [Streptomyces sp. WMMC500]
MQAHDGMFLDGRWRPAAGDGVIEVVDPADEQVIATVPAGTAADVDAAVAAARAAFPDWAATPPAERAARVRALSDALAARAEDVAATVTAELGAPLTFSRKVHATVPVAVSASYADIGASFPYEEKAGNSTVLHEPVGVVGAITPWNYPLHQIVAKAAPALAAGCAVVLKPAENTPLVARLFAEAVAAAGFPPGVLGVVTGLGAEAGRALVEHPGTDFLSFTGSTAVGRTVAAAAGAAVKPVALELGGKSANVILPGADLARAVSVGVANVMANSGQSCNAWTRMLVHRAAYDQALTLATTAVAKYAPGDPRDPATRLGPVVSAAQRDRVRGYIERGTAEGAVLLAGGPEAPAGRGRGYFVQPTVFADVTPEMTIAQEEIFGPVLAIMPYEDEDDALRIANGTVYGLAGAVWAGDDATAVAFARRMETGTVTVNGGKFDPLAPFGGYKQSGIGRELGVAGLTEFLHTKSLQF